MPGIGIISNPFARVNKRDPEHNTLMWYIMGNRGQFEVTNTLSDLGRVCKEFQQRDIGTIGIVGGDGTISLTLSAIAEAYQSSPLPKIMLLRGGTVNVVAANLGIFGKPKDVMSDFIESYHSGKPLAEMNLHTLRVNGRIGFLFANGTASRFLEEFYENKSSAMGAGLFLSKVFADGVTGGRLTGAFRRLVQASPMEVSTFPMPLVGEASPYNGIHNYSMVFASTVPKMPFGLHLYRFLDTSLPQAELLAVQSAGSTLVKQATRVFLGRAPTPEGIAQTLFTRASIRTEAGCKYTLDGDILETADGTIEIEIGPSFVFCSPYGKVL